ncbi:MAG: MinD/ParA family protein [Solidesulfovibrio sp.]
MPEAINPNASMSVAILSGKGGVGKTNLALNLSYALFRAGHRVLLMDFDVGLANVDVLLGLSPEKNLQDLFRPEITAEDVMLPVEPGGFDFLPAASGVPELLEMDDDMREILFQKLNSAFGNYDYLMLDLGAGISQTVLSVAVMSHLRVLVVTPEPTSLTDSYAVIKVLHTQYGVSDFHVLVNQVDGPKDTKTTFHRLAAACQHFLGFEPKLLGGVRADPALPDAVRHQIPLLRHSPKCPAALDILAGAVKLHRARQERTEMLRDMPVLGKIPRIRK